MHQTNYNNGKTLLVEVAITYLELSGTGSSYTKDELDGAGHK